MIAPAKPYASAIEALGATAGTSLGSSVSDRLVQPVKQRACRFPFPQGDQAGRCRMSRSWTYRNDDYSDDEIELTAENSAADDEPFTPVIKTNLSFDAFDEASANGILLDACAAEILRLDQRIGELEGAVRVSGEAAAVARIRRELLDWMAKSFVPLGDARYVDVDDLANEVQRVIPEVP